MRRHETDLRWEDLTDADRALICNGCGGKGSWIRPPAFRFEASCNHHDFGYWLGGDEDDRRTCDARFFGAMVSDAALLPWWRRPAHVVLAYVYFLAVRRCGAGFFAYGPPKTRADLDRLRGGA